MNKANHENAYNTFIKLYKDAYSTAFPKTKIFVNKQYIKREPWMTFCLLKSSLTKSKLLGKKLKNPTANDIANYKYLNKYNKIKRQMKTTYYRNLLEINKNNMKKTWQILNKALGKLNDKSSYPMNFVLNNKKVDNKTDIANGFISSFSCIGNATEKNIPKPKQCFYEIIQLIVCFLNQ